MNMKISQPAPPQDNRQTPSSETGFGPSDTKEIIYLASGLLVLVIGIGGILMYTEDEPLPATASQAVEHIQIAKAFASPDPQPALSGPTASNPMFAEESLAAPIAEPVANKPLEETNVYFTFNSSALTDEAKDAIKKHVESRPEGWTGTLRVMGHTDRQGSDAYNKALGLKRAESVKTYLISLGISEADIQVESLGKDGRVCEEETSTCFELNRRAHVAFLPSSTPLGEDVQLSMNPNSLNQDISAEQVTSTEDFPTVPSESEESFQQDIQEETIAVEPSVTVESLP